MRGPQFKQGKKTRKSMAMYTHVFGFRTPYRVLCDGNFLQAALDMKLFVKDLLPKTLLGPCVPVVSKCIRAELSHIGDAVSGVRALALPGGGASAGHARLVGLTPLLLRANTSCALVPGVRRIAGCKEVRVRAVHL